MTLPNENSADNAEGNYNWLTPSCPLGIFTPSEARIPVKEILGLIEGGDFWVLCTCGGDGCHAVDTRASKQKLIESILAFRPQ